MGEKLIAFPALKTDTVAWRCLKCGAFLLEDEVDDGCPNCGSDKLAEKVPAESVDDLISMLYRLNWVKILDEAVKDRPSAWNENPVYEWKNASDCIMNRVIEQVKKKVF